MVKTSFREWLVASIEPRATRIDACATDAAWIGREAMSFRLRPVRRRRPVSDLVRKGLAVVAIAGLVGCSAPSGSPSGAATPGAGSSSAGSSSAAGAGGGATISVAIKEWQIGLSSTTMSSGAITFNITNNGDKEHEFIVRKTDLKADSLPLGADGKVSEDAPELTAVGDPSEVAEIKSGSADRTLTVTLQPGHYVVFCNLQVGDLLHYQKGMHTDFTVN